MCGRVCVGACGWCGCGYNMVEVYKRKVYWCGSECLESFRSTRINPEFKKLPIENFYSAAAANSGPLALLYRRYAQKQLKLPDNYDASVLFFNCKGDLLRAVPFELKERVILFEFTPDERLLIVYANGLYFQIDPATAATLSGSLFAEGDFKPKTERCRGAHLVGERIVVLKERTVGVVEALGTPWKPYLAIKLHTDNPVFTAALSANGDLEIAYLSATATVELFNVRKWTEASSPPVTLYSSPAVKNNAGNLVSLVKEGEKVGLVFTDRAMLGLTTGGWLIFPFNEFVVGEDSLTVTDKGKQKYRNFYRLGFLGDALYFYDRVRLLLLSLSEPQFEIRHLSLNSLLAAGPAALRLLDEHTFTFRPIRIPLYYALVDHPDAANRNLARASPADRDLFLSFRALYNIYEGFMEKRAVGAAEVAEAGARAEEVWEAVVETAGLFIDPGEQLMALRFASFLLNYFGSAGRGRAMRALAQELRVVNGLRHEPMNRWLTYHEFQTLKANDGFLRLLLRYNMHFVADLIYEESAAKEAIFAHWARCKIEKETEAAALEEIKTRYREMKVGIGTTSVFTELARYCLIHKERPLIGLALQLIELEPHPARRAIVFLFTFLAKKDASAVDRMLDYAEHSASAPAIHQVIHSLRRASQDWLPAKAWLELLPRKPLLEYHYVRVLRANGDLEELKEYLTLNGLFVEMSYSSLAKELAKLQNPSLEAVAELVNKDYSKVLTSLADQLGKCTRRGGVEALRELKNKKYPITEEDAAVLTQDGELEVLAEIIIKKDANLPLAARILRKVKSDKVYALLLRKGKVKDAIEEAFARKNGEKLLELIPMADEPMQPLARQLYEELTRPR